jgi:ribosomal protein L11 methyltransferase
MVEGDYTFFFFDQEADEFIRPFLQVRPNLELGPVHRMKYTQWQDGADFSRLTVEPLVIIPAWAEVELDPGELLIRMDPGLAFGFGGHPTTYACLEALVRISQQDRLVSLLDLGAGTGILSLAGARLGAVRVRSVEWSQLAAETARKNVSQNHLEGIIEVVHGRAEDNVDFPAEVVCSNLHLQVQEAILERNGFQDRRWLILSGLFHSQAEKMERALLNKGYRVVDRIRDARWCSLLMRAG